MRIGAQGEHEHGSRAFARSVADIRSWLHSLRLLHYFNYSHVRQRRLLTLGESVAIAPNVSFANGQRIEIGAHSHIGARCSIWAGDTSGRIRLGHHALLGPEVMITASNYGIAPGTPVMDQPKIERDVIIGDDVWLGARVIVLPGVEIGDGCVVGAGAIVTRSLPPHSIAVGNPAKVVGSRLLRGVDVPQRAAPWS
jgi:acetyltransferase-like isoleucine patch superfamily enzyme